MSSGLHFLLNACFGADLTGRRAASYRILSYGLNDMVKELALATDNLHSGA